MAPKRKHEDTDPGVEPKDASKKLTKLKKGFSVPANLPDGTHRRKGSSRQSIEDGYFH
jgi:hypothetical protein